jgi:hypothetical protein
MTAVLFVVPRRALDTTWRALPLLSSPGSQLGQVFHPVVAGVAYVKRHEANRLIIASQIRSPH